MNSGPIDPESPQVHTYLPGQTLAELADKYGIGLDELSIANQLTEQSILFPGQKLVIPSSTRAQPIPTRPKEHLVAAGETLLGIANKYDIPVESIRKINRLTENAMLFPGTLLNLDLNTEVEDPVSDKFPKHCLIHGYHKVKAGDQLNRIAAFHAVTAQSLLTANNLGWNSVVVPGSKLIIPISHTALNCPSLVQLSATSMSIAEKLVEQGREVLLDDYGCVIALCLEMQRSGLQPELGNQNLKTELLMKLSQTDVFDNSVSETLREIGFDDLAEGAALWEPSAWLWLHQIGSKSE